MKIELFRWVVSTTCREAKTYQLVGLGTIDRIAREIRALDCSLRSAVLG
ncbi:hypothetical protein [Edaphosphingomonas haloaromaticamans]|nr:hypothetical protein [Sphingomonas haloaromaticamans]